MYSLSKGELLSIRLWEMNADIANKCLNTSFVQGIKYGTLPANNFKAYIAQDEFFLEAFAKAYGFAISKHTGKRSLIILSKLLSGVIEELRLHEHYLKKWEISNDDNLLNPATSSYTNFLLDTASKCSMLETITAMTPCLRLYSWIGKELLKENPESKNPYKNWINTYGGKTFEDLATSLELILDENSNKSNENNLIKIYSKAMVLELKFFEAYSQIILKA